MGLESCTDALDQIAAAIKEIGVLAQARYDYPTSDQVMALPPSRRQD